MIPIDVPSVVGGTAGLARVRERARRNRVRPGMNPEHFFMMRGDAVNDWNVKLLIAVLTIGLVVHDVRKNGRLDFLWVLLISSLFWFGLEGRGQLAGVRVIQERVLLGLDVTSHLWLTLGLQALAEASFWIVWPMWIVDQLLAVHERRARWRLVAIFCVPLVLYTLYLIPFAQEPVIGAPDAASRRLMFTTGQIVLWITVTLVLAYWLFRCTATTRRRAVWVFVFVALLGCYWQFSSWALGGRWVEVGNIDPEGGLQITGRASMLEEIALLLYSGIFEIGQMYLFFLALAYVFGLIRPYAEPA